MKCTAIFWETSKSRKHHCTTENYFHFRYYCGIFLELELAESNQWWIFTTTVWWPTRYRDKRDNSLDKEEIIGNKGFFKFNHVCFLCIISFVNHILNIFVICRVFLSIFSLLWMEILELILWFALSPLLIPEGASANWESH